MLQYTVDTENKTVCFLNGGSIDELKDIYEMFKGYSFYFSPQKRNFGDMNYEELTRKYGANRKVTFGDLCACNPANGGSGICGCIMGNDIVQTPTEYHTQFNNSNFGIQKGNEYMPIEGNKPI